MRCEGTPVKNLGYVLAAYTIIWTVLFLYIVHLARKNKEVRDDLRALQAQIDQVRAKRDA